MYNSRYTKRSPSEASAVSHHQAPVQRLKSPVASDYEYLGRLVTRERAIVRRSQSIQQNLIFPQNTNKYQHSMRSHHQDVYKDASNSSSDDDTDDPDGLNKPLGIIRISDRHYREIYRLPTPPPKVKRVFHRLQSPEPKIIERVFVRRHRPKIIENVIEVPPEKVRIINREKYLEKPAPITRSRLVHLKSRHHHNQGEEEGQQQQQQEMTCNPSEQYCQQQETTTHQQSQGAATKLVYPPQQNMKTVGYIKSTVPPEVMFKSQQPIQIPASEISNQQMFQSTPYDQPPQQPTTYQMVPPTANNYPPQQPVDYQMMPPTTNNYPPQQPVDFQMIPPTTYNYPPQQPVSYQMVQPTPYTNPPQQPVSYQMAQPTPYTYPPQQPINQPMPYSYPSQQPMPNPPYGFPQYQ